MGAQAARDAIGLGRRIHGAGEGAPTESAKRTRLPRDSLPSEPRVATSARAVWLQHVAAACQGVATELARKQREAGLATQMMQRTRQSRGRAFLALADCLELPAEQLRRLPIGEIDVRLGASRHPQAAAWRQALAAQWQDLQHWVLAHTDRDWRRALAVRWGAGVLDGLFATWTLATPFDGPLPYRPTPDTDPATRLRAHAAWLPMHLRETLPLFHTLTSHDGATLVASRGDQGAAGAAWSGWCTQRLASAEARASRLVRDRVLEPALCVLLDQLTECTAEPAAVRDRVVPAPPLPHWATADERGVCLRTALDHALVRHLRASMAAVAASDEGSREAWPKLHRFLTRIAQMHHDVVFAAEAEHYTARRAVLERERSRVEARRRLAEASSTAAAMALAQLDRFPLRRWVLHGRVLHPSLRAVFEAVLEHAGRLHRLPCAHPHTLLPVAPATGLAERHQKTIDAFVDSTLQRLHQAQRDTVYTEDRVCLEAAYTEVRLRVLALAFHQVHIRSMRELARALLALVPDAAVAPGAVAFDTLWLPEIERARATLDARSLVEAVERDQVDGEALEEDFAPDTAELRTVVAEGRQHLLDLLALVHALYPREDDDADDGAAAVSAPIAELRSAGLPGAVTEAMLTQPLCPSPETLAVVWNEPLAALTERARVLCSAPWVQTTALPLARAAHNDLTRVCRVAAPTMMQALACVSWVLTAWSLLDGLEGLRPAEVEIS